MANQVGDPDLATFPGAHDLWADHPSPKEFPHAAHGKFVSTCGSASAWLKGPCRHSTCGGKMTSRHDGRPVPPATGRDRLLGTGRVRASCSSLDIVCRPSVELAQRARGEKRLSSAPVVTTMRLRYSGTCGGCNHELESGDTAHYLRANKTVRCLTCGPGREAAPLPPATGSPAPVPATPAAPTTAPTSAVVEMAQGPLSKAARCSDCGRSLRSGTDALCARTGPTVLCLECVTLDTVYSLGEAGGGARREHAKRLIRHQACVRTAHPKLGGLMLVLNDDPGHVQAWQKGAVGEEMFGHRLSSIASPTLKVLHDRKLPRSVANIDHLAVTSEAVWVLDAKRYTGKVETRGHGLFSRRPPDLYVGGRNQMKLVDGVKRQVETVEGILAAFAAEHGIPEVPVRGGLVFVHAEFGLFTSPFAIDGVWAGWGKAARTRLSGQTAGRLPVADIAKRLARELRAG